MPKDASRRFQLFEACASSLSGIPVMSPRNIRGAVSSSTVIAMPKAVSVSAALQPPPDIAAATVSSVSIPASSVSYIAKKSFMSSSMCALVFIYHIPYFPRCKWDFLDIGGKCGIIISFAISQRRFISGGQIRVLSPGNCERQRSSWKTKERKSSLGRCCS